MAISLIMFGWLLMFAGLVVWALQGLAWLYYGEWITYSLLDLWRMLEYQAPRFEWKGLERFVLWAMQLSAGQALMLVGLTLTVGVNLLADRNEKARTKAEQKRADEKRRMAKAKLAEAAKGHSLEVGPN
jgi:hypothetical protein